MPAARAERRARAEKLVECGVAFNRVLIIVIITTIITLITCITVIITIVFIWIGDGEKDRITFDIVPIVWFQGLRKEMRKHCVDLDGWMSCFGRDERQVCEPQAPEGNSPLVQIEHGAQLSLELPAREKRQASWDHAKSSFDRVGNKGHGSSYSAPRYYRQRRSESELLMFFHSNCAQTLLSQLVFSPLQRLLSYYGLLTARI